VVPEALWRVRVAVVVDTQRPQRRRVLNVVVLVVSSLPSPLPENQFPLHHEDFKTMRTTLQTSLWPDSTARGKRASTYSAGFK
jgi:hypothetical protein